MYGDYDLSFLRVDTKGCFLFLTELSKLVTLRPMEGDFITEFITSASSLFQGNEVDLALRPLCPSMEAFRELVLELVSKGGVRGGVRWQSGESRGCVCDQDRVGVRHYQSFGADTETGTHILISKPHSIAGSSHYL